jgi:hypothetical protein
VEECPRKIRDIINVFSYLTVEDHGEYAFDISTEVSDMLYAFLISHMALTNAANKQFNELKEAMITAEIHLLAKLGFNVHVQHPHGFMINYLQSLGLSDRADIAQTAWNYLNDR